MTNAVVPNSFQTPNVYVDRLMQWLTPEEWIALSFAVRHILGWQDKINSRKTRISLSMFEHGTSVDFGGCGLSRPRVKRALIGLTQFRIMTAVGKPTKSGQEWQLPDESAIDWGGLKKRKEAKLQRGKKRVAKATKASADKRRKPAAGTPDVPPEKVAEGYAGRTATGTPGVPLTGTLDVHKETHSQTHPQTHKDSAEREKPFSAPPQGDAEKTDDPPAPKPKTPHQAMFGAIVKSQGWNQDTLTKDEKSKIGKVATQLVPVAKPDQIEALWQFIKAKAIDDKWTAKPSIHAMTSYWSEFAKTIAPPTAPRPPIHIQSESLDELMARAARTKKRLLAAEGRG